MDNKYILIRCKNCRSEIVWTKNRLCKICKTSLHQNRINPSNSQINENKRLRRRVKAPPIQNRGWVYGEKNQEMIRILLLNPNGIGTDSYEKIK